MKSKVFEKGKKFIMLSRVFLSLMVFSLASINFTFSSYGQTSTSQMCDSSSIDNEARLQYYKLQNSEYYKWGIPFVGFGATFVGFKTYMHLRDPQITFAKKTPRKGKSANPAQIMTPLYVASLGFVGSYLGMFFNQYMIANIFKDNFTNSFKNLSQYFSQKLTGQTFLNQEDSPFIKYYKFKLNFQCRQNLSNSRKEFITSLINEIDKSFFFSNGDLKSFLSETQFNNIIYKLNLLLKIPSQVKPFTSNLEIRKAVENIHSHHHIEEGYFLLAQGVNEHIKCKQNKKNNCLDGDQSIILLGDPGTGKTTSTEKFAKATNRLLVDVKFNMFKETIMEGFRHTSREPRDILARYAETSSTVGITSAILEALSKNEGKSFNGMLFFFDEFDKSYNTNDYSIQFMKAAILTQFDPNNKELYLPDLGVVIEFKEHFALLSVNAPLNSEALNDRIPTLIFPEIENKTRFKIVEQFYERFSEYHDPDYRELDLAFIVKMVLLDQNPGVRKLEQCVKKYFRTQFLSRSEGIKLSSFDEKAAEECLSKETKQHKSKKSNSKESNQENLAAEKLEQKLEEEKNLTPETSKEEAVNTKTNQTCIYMNRFGNGNDSYEFLDNDKKALVFSKAKIFANFLKLNVELDKYEEKEMEEESLLRNVVYYLKEIAVEEPVRKNKSRNSICLAVSELIEEAPGEDDDHTDKQFYKYFAKTFSETYGIKLKEDIDEVDNVKVSEFKKSPNKDEAYSNMVHPFLTAFHEVMEELYGTK